MTDERGDIVADGRLRRLWLPISLAAGISGVVGFTDALATAGLAAFLTAGVAGLSGSVGGPTWIAEPWVIAGLTILTFLLNLLIGLLREWSSAQWSAKRRKDLIRAFAEADLATQRTYGSGRLTVGSEQIGAASSSIGNLIGLLNNILRTAIYIAGAFLASWQVALVAGISGGVLVLGLRLISLRTRIIVRHTAAEAIDIGEAVGDMATSARELQMLSRWDQLRRRVSLRIDRVTNLGFRSRMLAGLVGPVFALGTGAVGLAVGMSSRASGVVNVPNLAASGFLLVRALGAAQSSQTAYQQLHDTLPYVERVLTMITELRRSAHPGSRDLDSAVSAVELKGVSLSHGRDEVVHDLSVRFDGTGGTAIVGPSGSGKSTTLAALAGLIHPSTGAVLLEGVPLSDLSRRTLGEQLGVLPQDPQLLRANLRENLVRDGVAVTDERLWQVLESVGLTETVEAFDNGLDTDMGRLGEGFSGGELQRLGLARLIVNQPTIWLLDEPTSALDRRNSELVSELISEAMEEHQVILVTHRPELLAACRRVVVIIDGRLVDDGELDEVAARQPFLASMLGHEQPH